MGEDHGSGSLCHRGRRPGSAPLTPASPKPSDEPVLPVEEDQAQASSRKKALVERDESGILPYREVALPKPQSDPGRNIFAQSGQGWFSGSDFPLQVFEGFKLPSDDANYAGLPRPELVTRCMEGMGKALSAFNKCEKEKDLLEGRLQDAIRKLEIYRDQRRSWNEERSFLKAEIDSLKAGDAMPVQVVRLDHAEDVKRLHPKMEDLCPTAAMTQDGCSGTFEEGYNACFNRFVADGADGLGKSFKDFGEN